MATVVSITAERAAAIEAASITGAFLSGDNLILRTRGGSEINVGAIKANALDAWPVGSIFIGATSDSPATLLGGGSWSRFGDGRVLVSQKGDDTDFDVAGDTGGSKTITTAMLPPHTHSGPSHTHTGTTSGVGDHSHSYTEPNAQGGMQGGGATTISDDTFHGNATGGAGAHSHTFTTDAGGTGETGNGPGTSATHMPPYIVVYMWRRTA